jgi:hypothetical protein
MRTSDDAGGADQAALLVALFVQRNFEKMLAAFDGDDRGIGRFAASRQFASDLRGMLQCAFIASTHASAGRSARWCI